MSTEQDVGHQIILIQASQDVPPSWENLATSPHPGPPPHEGRQQGKTHMAKGPNNLVSDQYPKYPVSPYMF